MNYAKTQPDLAIMAVNTFVKDCVDPNPLIRALAVRTMGCIRVDKITEVVPLLALVLPVCSSCMARAVPLRAAAQVPQGRGPLRAQDRRHLRRQALRH
jgi:hypothetical protein